MRAALDRSHSCCEHLVGGRQSFSTNRTDTKSCQRLEAQVWNREEVLDVYEQLRPTQESRVPNSRVWLIARFDTGRISVGDSWLWLGCDVRAIALRGAGR